MENGVSFNQQSIHPSRSATIGSTFVARLVAWSVALTSSPLALQGFPACPSGFADKPEFWVDRQMATIVNKKSSKGLKYTTYDIRFISGRAASLAGQHLFGNGFPLQL